jgi:hypothetical protein
MGAKGKVGRPAKVIDRAKVEELAGFGFTWEEIAGIIGVASSTLRAHIDADEAFSATVKAAKDKADNEVIRGLYRRACGGKWGDKEYPPDTTAAAIWLNNRRPKDWKQRKIEVDIPEGKRLIIEDAD